MNLSKLPKITVRKAKRLGQGYGSGKGGHTSSRGQKGQKARGSIPQSFEGTKIKKSFLKRLPLLRGKGKLKPLKEKTVTLKLSQLADWPVKQEVNVENLVKNGLIAMGVRNVKILDGGEIKSALNIRVKTSVKTAEKITKAGGKILSQ